MPLTSLDTTPEMVPRSRGAINTVFDNGSKLATIELILVKEILFEQLGIFFEIDYNRDFTLLTIPAEDWNKTEPDDLNGST